jgi:hypothetical protein
MRVLIGLIAIGGCFAAVAYGATRQRAADDGRSDPGALARGQANGGAGTGRPPKPRITQHPEAQATSPNARFAFNDREARVRFQCRLDGARWQACKAPVSFASLAVGSHVFSVRAVGSRGRRSKVAKFRWRLLAPMAFEISQRPSGLADLYPGAPAQSLSIAVHNPNPVPILVTSLQVSVSADPAGCASAENLALGQSNASTSTPLTVPGGGSVALPAQGISAPTIALRDLPVNQDACQGARFPLRFTGSAHG